MCGIAGIYSKNRSTQNQSIVLNMLRLLNHRGPDGAGIYEDSHVCLGHRRLSIIDLSANGKQPMTKGYYNLTITFNGEIYNYLELKQELEQIGYNFDTNTDTEVILYSYLEWGRYCLKRFNGMWAFAIWDSNKEELFCARDRFGIKPFYYSQSSDDFRFSSEIKPLIQALNNVEPNYQAVYDFLIYNQLNHEEETFFKDIYQLLPAHYCIVNREGLTFQKYWDINPGNRFTGSLIEAGEKFVELFADSVKLHLRSDVEVGSCLSGGLDSSAIVCMANQICDDKDTFPLNSFSLISSYAEYDESKWVHVVKSHITRLNSILIHADHEEFIKNIDELVLLQEEPFGSTSIFGQYMVMKEIHNHGLKVTLDGQGADEVLSGYLRYADAYFADLFFKNKTLFEQEAEIFANKHSLSREITIERAKQLLKPVNGNRFILSNQQYLDESFAEKYYNSIKIKKGIFDSYLQNQLYQDVFQSSLPSLLRFQDRNSMHFSIEGRVPFLDYRLVEFLFSLPTEMKMNGTITKVILRNSMQGILPKEIINRQDKLGFVTPEHRWFRNELMQYIESIINSISLAKREFLNIKRIREEWDALKTGKSNNNPIIWRIISLELWFRKFID